MWHRQWFPQCSIRKHPDSMLAMIGTFSRVPKSGEITSHVQNGPRSARWTGRSPDLSQCNRLSSGRKFAPRNRQTRFPGGGVQDKRVPPNAAVEEPDRDKRNRRTKEQER